MHALKLRTFERTQDDDAPFPFPRNDAGSRWRPRLGGDEQLAPHAPHAAEEALEEAQRRLDALRTMMNSEFDDDDGPRAA